MRKLEPQFWDHMEGRLSNVCVDHGMKFSPLAILPVDFILTSHIFLDIIRVRMRERLRPNY